MRTLRRIRSAAALPLGVLVVLPIVLLLTGCGRERPPVLGVALPLSGPASGDGQAIERGVRLAEERLRRAHADGSYPYDLEIRVADTAGDPERAAERLDALYDGGALAALGGASDAEALAMAEVAREEGRVLLAPTASTGRLAGISRHVFRLHPSAAHEAEKMGAFAVHDLGLERVAILAARDRFSLDLAEAFRESFEGGGGAVAGVIRHVPAPGAIPAAVDRLLAVEPGPEGVYLAAPEADPAAREALRELARRGYRGAVLSTSAFTARRVVEAMDRGTEGLVVPRSAVDPARRDGPDAEAPEVRELVEAYREAYGEEPDPRAAYGYDALMILARALEDQGPVPYQLWQGVRGLEDYRGATGPIRFDERGEAGRFPRIYVLRGGELQRFRDLDERAKNRLASL